MRRKRESGHWMLRAFLAAEQWYCVTRQFYAARPTASVAQSAARGFHNPKVVSSSLTDRNFFPRAGLPSARLFSGGCRGGVAEWSKAPDLGSGLSGRGFEPHRRQVFSGLGFHSPTTRSENVQAGRPRSADGLGGYDVALTRRRSRVRVPIGVGFPEVPGIKRPRSFLHV
ncbi:unnamed protein product [Trypanosoma congolense IL3000]|uniref:WGS project CAEQ00000000 data, annotated contig 307 n=1 Tax=Trypanosoma congolense (strain IL3000) TaxID=1068625 RepID=F9WER5_TRYCI|nr:unnamed protein product [Trypanosoma congolense IL3000]